MIVYLSALPLRMPRSADSPSSHTRPSSLHTLAVYSATVEECTVSYNKCVLLQFNCSLPY